jgi:S-adenosylmethionine-dependent methyltransferase
MSTTNRAQPTPPPDQVGVALAELAAGFGPGGLVIDVGGGSGTRAVPLAEMGCRVLVVDSSVDALAMLKRRAVDAGVSERIEGVQADADGLDSVTLEASADLVLCHHLLEELDDPVAAVAAFARTMKPGGHASIVTVGRLGAALSQAAAGRFQQSMAILTEPDGRYGFDDPLRRRFDATELQNLVERSGLQVRSIVGVGVLSAIAGGALRQQPVDHAGGGGLEAIMSTHPILREIGGDLHIVAQAPGRGVEVGP